MMFTIAIVILVIHVMYIGRKEDAYNNFAAARSRGMDVGYIY